MVFTIIFTFASCQEAENNNYTTSNDLSTRLTRKQLKTLENTNWMFSNYSANPTEFKYEGKISLKFGSMINNEQAYLGTALVNNYGGVFKVDIGKGLIVEKRGEYTTLASGSEKENTLETRYNENLHKGTFFEIKNNKLLIYLGDTSNLRTEIMTFIQKK